MIEGVEERYKYLHSTMVLLKSDKSIDLAWYILDLHSTMVLLKFFILAVNSSTLFLSTFHYGSIKITYTLSHLSTTRLSTFHYGSIKINNHMKSQII